MDLEGRRAIAAGADPGLGRGISQTLALAGDEVLVNDVPVSSG